MTTAADIESIHRVEVREDDPFPWGAVCPCGWRSRRVASTRDAAIEARLHLIQVGMDAA